MKKSNPSWAELVLPIPTGWAAGGGTKESDADYFARRAAEEDEAALRAARPESAEVHKTLARKYRELAAHYRERDGR